MELVNKLSSLEQKLFTAKEAIHKNKGHDPETVARKMQNEMKEIIEKRQKNNPMDSQEVGAWAELVPDVMTIQTVVDNASKSPRFAFLDGLAQGKLPWVLSKTNDLPIVGEVVRPSVKSERETGAYVPSADKRRVTDKVTLNVQKIGMDVGISTELELYWPSSVLWMMRSSFADSMFFGIADSVLNADSNPAATGNINSVDQLATTTLIDGAQDVNFLYDNSLRKSSLLGTVGTDYIQVAWAVTLNDILRGAWKMRFDSTPSQRIVIIDNETYHNLMQDIDFRDRSRNGEGSTITQGAVTNIAGMDFFVTDLLRKSTANGTLSGATPANNTRGNIVIAQRNVIQHGFASDIITNVIDFDINKGVIFQANVHFGFANINKRAGVTQPSIVTLTDIDLS